MRYLAKVNVKRGLRESSFPQQGCNNPQNGGGCYALLLIYREAIKPKLKD